MSSYVDLDRVLETQGLTLVETVKDDYDHGIHLVRRDEQVLVLKVNADPELQKGLEREVSATLLVRVLERAQQDWSVGTSVPVATGRGWLLREHVDRPPLLEEGRCDLAQVARLGRALADLDRLAPDPSTSRPSYRDGAGEPVAGPQERSDEVARWLSELEEQGALGDLDRAEVQQRLERGRDAVKPGFEVWDVELDDFLDLPDGRTAVYDLEWAHPFGRRYYDLAVLHALLAVQLGEREAARELLRAFLDRSPLPQAEVEPAALVVLAEALLARLYDAGADDPGRASVARELLGALLAQGLPALL